MTVEQVFLEVDFQCNDTTRTRFPVVMRYLYLNDCIRIIRNKRADTKISTTNGAITSFTDLTGTSDIIPLDDSWRPACASYLCWRWFSADADDKADAARADTNFKLFTSLLGI